MLLAGKTGLRFGAGVETTPRPEFEFTSPSEDGYSKCSKLARGIPLNPVRTRREVLQWLFQRSRARNENSAKKRHSHLPIDTLSCGQVHWGGVGGGSAGQGGGRGTRAYNVWTLVECSTA
eukprot:913939-Amphidinium_carterae.1